MHKFATNVEGKQPWKLVSLSTLNTAVHQHHHRNVLESTSSNLRIFRNVQICARTPSATLTQPLNVCWTVFAYQLSVRLEMHRSETRCKIGNDDDNKCMRYRQKLMAQVTITITKYICASIRSWSPIKTICVCTSCHLVCANNVTNVIGRCSASVCICGREIARCVPRTTHAFTQHTIFGAYN